MLNYCEVQEREIEDLESNELKMTNVLLARKKKERSRVGNGFGWGVEKRRMVGGADVVEHQGKYKMGGSESETINEACMLPTVPLN